MNWINFPQSGTFILFFMADSISYWYWFFLIQGFVITLMSVPVITTLARKYQLVYVPNQRSSHSIPVPALGGVAIYAGFMISFLLLRYVGYMESLKVSVVIFLIFIIGLIDDLLDLRASWKMLVFVILATTIAFSQGLAITNLHGFLSITHINGFFSYAVTIFAILAIINAVNLIDGVDGLAGGLGIFVLSILSWVFYQANHPDFLILTLPMILALLAFLIFNVWGKNYKIFMGDSGSLMLGMVISISLIRFMQLKHHEVNEVITISPVTAFSLVIVPMFDMIHVFIKRLLKGRSPFHPGKEHIHHTYIKLGFSHRKVTLILIAYSIGFFTISLISSKFLSEYLSLAIVIGLALFVWNYPEFYLKRNMRKYVLKKNTKDRKIGKFSKPKTLSEEIINIKIIETKSA